MRINSANFFIDFRSIFHHSRAVHIYMHVYYRAGQAIFIIIPYLSSINSRINQKKNHQIKKYYNEVGEINGPSINSFFDILLLFFGLQRLVEWVSYQYDPIMQVFKRKFVAQETRKLGKGKLSFGQMLYQKIMFFQVDFYGRFTMAFNMFQFGNKVLV